MIISVKGNSYLCFMQLRIIFSFSILSVFLLGCTKEPDDRSPVIEYIFPSEGHRYEQEEIRLTVRISHNKQLKSVRIGLVDFNYIPIIQTVSFNVTASDTLIDFAFFLNDPAAQFKLYVQASDGVNSKNKYLNVSKDASVNRKSGLLFIEDKSDSFVLNRLTGNEGAVKLALINQRITHVCNGGNTGLVYSLTSYPSKIMAHDFGTGAFKWSFEAPMPELKINHMAFHADKLVVAEKSGILRLLHALNGQTLAVNQENMDNEPLMVMSDGEYIYVWQKSRNTQQKTLGLFYQGTLSMFRSIHIDDNLIGMFEEDGYSIITAHYMGNTLMINRLTKVNQLVDPLYEIQLPNLLHIKQISAGKLLLVCTTHLSELDISNGYVTRLVVQQMITDGIVHEGNTYFSSGNNLHHYGNASLTFQGIPTLLTVASYIHD